ncbi:hypothetical protein HDU91_000568 [Kappamyces sp. JEL0680]|nr:hypothetical protein HDU91_000568 [Kappamyces sp. JEL0680]
MSGLVALPLLSLIGDWLNRVWEVEQKAVRNTEGLSVQSLFIYPIKSCGGIELQTATIASTGFQFDRNWILAERDLDNVNSESESPWKMVTQRADSCLVMVKPSVMDSNGDIALKVSYPGLPDLIIPRRIDATSQLVPIPVWGRIVMGVDQGPEASAWFSKVLNRPVSLFVKHPDYRRSLSAKHVPNEDWFQHGPPETAFADGFPFLLLSQASTDEFNKQTPVTIKRFRPNIVIRGAYPYQEETWLKLRIGSELFVIANRCTRCEMTNNDPLTGISTPVTLKELMKTRRVDPGAKYEPCMGVNAIQIAVGGTISVDDPVVPVSCGILDKRGIWNGNSFPSVPH